MSRILDYIAKYDENLTIAQLKKAIKAQEELKEKKETEEIERVKNTYQNKYLMHLEDDGIFGKTLSVYSFRNLVRKERNTDWTFIYYFEGEIISFSLLFFNHRVFNTDRSDNSFSEKDLNKMQFINEEKFKQYLYEYNKINKKLNNLIDGN